MPPPTGHSTQQAARDWGGGGERTPGGPALHLLVALHPEGVLAEEPGASGRAETRGGGAGGWRAQAGRVPLTTRVPNAFLGPEVSAAQRGRENPRRRRVRGPQPPSLSSPTPLGALRGPHPRPALQGSGQACHLPTQPGWQLSRRKWPVFTNSGRRAVLPGRRETGHRCPGADRTAGLRPHSCPRPRLHPHSRPPPVPIPVPVPVPIPVPIPIPIPVPISISIPSPSLSPGRAPSLPT